MEESDYICKYTLNADSRLPDHIKLRVLLNELIANVFFDTPKEIVSKVLEQESETINTILNLYKPHEE